MARRAENSMSYWQKTLANGNPLLELPIDKVRTVKLLLLLEAQRSI